MHFSKPVVAQLVLELVQETGQVEAAGREEGGIGFFPCSAVQFCKIISSFSSDFAQGCNEAQYYLLKL